MTSGNFCWASEPLVPGLLCLLRSEERIFWAQSQFSVVSASPTPVTRRTASRCLLSPTATILCVSPSPHLPDSHRKGSCPWLPYGDWRSPPPGKPCVPARVPSGDSLCRASPAGRTGPGVLAPTLSNLCVNRRPCLAPRGDRGPSELVELRL